MNTTKSLGLIPAHALKGLMRCAADCDTRYYLIGVHADPAAGTLTATNGQILLMVKQAFAEPVRPFTIPSELIRRALKCVTKHAPNLAVSVTDEPGARLITLSGCKGQVEAREIDGKFPDVSRVIPRAPSGKSAIFNPDLLATVKRAILDAVNEEKYPPVPHLTHNGDRAALYTCKVPTVMGLVMPMRPGDDHSAATLAAFGYAPEPKNAAKPKKERKARTSPAVAVRTPTDGARETARGNGAAVS